MKVFLNGLSREVPAGAALGAVLALSELGEPARGTAVAVDGAVVPRGEVSCTRLHEGARVEVVTAVQGG